MEINGNINVNEKWKFHFMQVLIPFRILFRKKQRQDVKEKKYLVICSIFFFFEIWVVFKVRTFWVELTIWKKNLSHGIVHLLSKRIEANSDCYGKDRMFYASFAFCWFSTISSQFFAIYICIFHKTEVQTVILRCLPGLNSNWFKNYDIKGKYFHFLFIVILFKNTHFQNLCFCILCHNFCTN